MKLGIIIPAYNEEKRIQKTLLDYLAFFSKKNQQIEILVMMDGCSDATPKIVKDVSSKHKQIKYKNYEKRLGKGSAILLGFRILKCDIISFTDADDSIPPDQFYRLFLTVKDFDAIISSRYIKGSVIKRRQGSMRILQSRIFNLIVKFLFGLSYKDTQCGAKVFRKHVIDKILPEMKSRGFEFDAELVWRIKRRGFAIKEMPIVWENKIGSTVRLKSTVLMLFRILKIRLFDFS